MRLSLPIRNFMPVHSRRKSLCSTPGQSLMCIVQTLAKGGRDGSEMLTRKPTRIEVSDDVYLGIRSVIRPRRSPHMSAIPICRVSLEFDGIQSARIRNRRAPRLRPCRQEIHPHPVHLGTLRPRLPVRRDRQEIHRDHRDHRGHQDHQHHPACLPCS